MGKMKKKDSKKGERERSAQETSDEGSFKISPGSITPSDEQHSSSMKSIPQEEHVKQTEPPVVSPSTDVYEEPVLTQLIVEKYEGELLNGLYEREGVAYFKGGNMYTGMFSEGTMHGKGTYTWKDGLTFEGDFYMNFPMGHGVYKWPDGSRYEGEVHKAIRHGHGIYTSSNQQVSYVGDWHKGTRNGKGVIYYNKEGTSWYEGDWISNRKEGWGVQCFSSGNIYEGQWKNNTFHGMGKMRWLTSNEEYAGHWENGIQNGSGTHTWFLRRIAGTQYSLRNEYVGNFVNGIRQGQGQFYYANGAMYDGEWNNNKKHGQGKFIFKNGQIYIGEFVEDQIAEYPNFKYDRVNTPDLSGIRTQSSMNLARSGTSRYNTGIPSLSGSYIELDLSALLYSFPEEDRQEELKQVEYAVLRNLTDLRKIYKLYSQLGSDGSPDNTLLMTKLQFWRFLKDCKLHHYSITLSEMDRILTVENTDTEEVHSPHSTMLLRTFLTNIVYLAYHICQTGNQEKNISLADCFTKVMTQNIRPHATNITGFLFSDAQKASYAISYIEKSWEVYRLYCTPNPFHPYEPTMKMRHFLLLMNDLKIPGLTATNIVDILATDDPCVRIDQEVNLELELTFLEFFEALLGCASICVPEEQIQQSENKLLKGDEPIGEVTTYLKEDQPEHSFQADFLQDLFLRSSINLKDKRQSPSMPVFSTKKQHREARAEKWFHQTDIFFLKKFFPAHEHKERLKEEIPKIRERQAEKARQQQIKEEEEARLKAEREAEEARRIEQEKLEKANALMEAEHAAQAQGEEQSPQPPPTPHDDSLIIPPQPGTKTATASRKKRK
ncbi:radial spoke head 10 homolog B [Xenopus laevis]|uniref:Radial spoke head 10 homolog B n=1 Tax=Xenopus laevis TaxID=8355 RepID=A0A8J1M061_XENLA|nr:radial spoke head 10 homolog B [Xenopus laevis]